MYKEEDEDVIIPQLQEMLVEEIPLSTDGPFPFPMMQSRLEQGGL